MEAQVTGAVRAQQVQCPQRIRLQPVVNCEATHVKHPFSDGRQDHAAVESLFKSHVLRIYIVAIC